MRTGRGAPPEAVKLRPWVSATSECDRSWCRSPSCCSRPVAVKGSPEAKGIQKIKHIVMIMQENRTFDSYFGTFPGADGIPMENGVPTVCSPDPVDEDVRPAVRRSCRRQHGRAARRPVVRERLNGGKMDGFVATARRSQTGCADENDPACSASTDKNKTTDVMGYHPESDIPNYWAYARNFVLQDRMFEPTASWSLPAHLFQVSAWSADCEEHDDPASCKNAIMPTPRPPGGKPLFLYQRDKPIYAWTDLTYLLHKQDVSWRLLRRGGDRAGLRGRRERQLPGRRPGRAHAGDLEPAAALRHRAQERPGQEHPVGREVLRRREVGRSPRGVVGRAVGQGERASAVAHQRRRRVRDEPHQHGDERPGLGFDRDLPGVGRLGRLLRPCRTAESSTRTVTASACRASSSVRTRRRAWSTTRR